MDTILLLQSSICARLSSSQLTFAHCQAVNSLERGYLAVTPEATQAQEANLMMNQV